MGAKGSPNQPHSKQGNFGGRRGKREVLLKAGKH